MSTVAGRTTRPAPTPVPVPTLTPPSNPVADSAPVESASCFRLVTRVPTYSSCVVEKGASLHVHYPDLNACRVQRTRSQSPGRRVDSQSVPQCRTIHFGYAIPVLVQRPPTGGGFEIVFDGDAPLEPRAAVFLLEHHPDLVALACRRAELKDGPSGKPPGGESRSESGQSGDIGPARPTPPHPHPYPPPPPSSPAPPFPPDPGPDLDPNRQPVAPPRGHHLARTAHRQSHSTGSKLATLTTKSTEIRPHHRSGSQTPLAADGAPSAGKMPVDPNELYDQLMRQSSAEQDIKAIAKQISDHAEAIYQTWKSKGLTPGELLQLHGNAKNAGASAASDTDTSGKVGAAAGSSQLRDGKSPSGRSGSPQFRQHAAGQVTSPERPKSGSSLSPVDLLASPRLEATLEQLVNSFVQEDKARLAARGRQTSPSPVPAAAVQPKTVLPSSSPSPIQTALKRFEKKGLNYETRSISPSQSAGINKSTTFHEAVQSAAAARPSDSPETVKSRAQKFASRIEMANSSSSSLTTWPSKRVAQPQVPPAPPAPPSADKKSNTIVVTEVSYEVAAAPSVLVVGPAVTLSPLKMSQVDQEEERLINALKTGEVIEDGRTCAGATSVDDLLVKKIRDKPQRVNENTLGRQSLAKTGQQAEEELESLVDRLKNLEPQGAPGRGTTSTLASRESSPHLAHEESPSRSTSPRSVKLSDTVAVSGVSTVDYAKVRFQAAQAYPLTQQRMEDTKSIGKGTNILQPNVVSETRSRFENSPSRSPPWRSEWSPTRHQTTEVDPTPKPTPTPTPTPPPPEKPVTEVPVQCSSQNGSTNVSPANSAPAMVSPEAMRRKSRKLRKSPEPGGGSSTASSTSSPLPHPELTVQQRQHLRERNLQQQQQQQQQGINSQNGIAAVAATSVGGVQYTASGIPIRPFLTRGSVAERVLIFEKCPTAISADPKEKNLSSASASSSAEKKTRTHPTPSTSTTWRHTGDVQSRTQVYAKDNNKENNHSSSPVISPKSTLRRQAKVNNNVLLPRFYFPMGRPNSNDQLETVVQRINNTFHQFPNCQATREHFGTIAKACGVPLYWKMILFNACDGEKVGCVTMDKFVEFWKKVLSHFHDEAARFVYLLTVANPSRAMADNKQRHTDSNFNAVHNGTSGLGGRTFLVPDDFVPLVQDVVDTHPGLTFLKEATEFHSRYVHTVIARIFYNVNRSWSGQISLSELRHSNLLSTIRLLEDEDDINQITDFFSYEHFYVIYCKFWELDKDHDLFIDKKDLARHNDHAISSRMIDRIFSGAVTRGTSSPNNKLAKFTSGNHNTNNNGPRMSYTEFVWFLISEEDKRHPTAIEYWFRCMDLDGDGYISMYELEYFYEEQLQRMESLGIETLPFEDCLCQMLDMIRPTVPGKISLSDMKRCQMAPIFFDTFFNLEKYLDHEQRDPFASQRDPESESGDETLKMSDWDRYAAEEYELLVAEEGGPDHTEDMFMREEMAADDGPSLPMMDGVLESDSSFVTHPIHGSLFNVTPCSIEYQY